MFEAAELGRKVAKADYAAAEPALHMALLEAQQQLRSSNSRIIILVSGVEGAGKGDVVNLLNRWLDSRGIRTQAFWDETDDDRMRPHYWRFWHVLPARGTIGIFFGSWYTEPVVNHVFGRTSSDGFEGEMRRIVEFERLLVNDGACFVKFWFHLTKKAQQKRLQAEKGRYDTTLLKKFAKHYDRFREVSERAIRITDTGWSPWHIVEAHDKRYRNLTVGQTLLDAAKDLPQAEPKRFEPPAKVEINPVTVLDQLDTSLSLDQETYESEVAKYQARLNRLTWKARDKQRNTVVVFEGWDAAGKGGAIRRITAGMDARLYRVISIAAPTDEEKAQHYLWRFWRHIPRAGHATIYDRSWYGRVLVERVEGFATEHEWKRAYQEINDFEEQLVDHGIIVAKFWLHITPEEQFRRFQERETTKVKQYKITAEDWRNREKWNAYEEAVNDMVAHTSTNYAPWTLIPANDKKHARVQVLRTLCKRLHKALNG